ncbi:MAG: hypothetical protein GF307_11330, partial [candidate division Zixibacteria bacterium]|nr:hypothetical protein [candidate division Zixibacteria bacterium]
MIDNSKTGNKPLFENHFERQDSDIFYLNPPLVDNPNIKAGFILQDAVKAVDKPYSILSSRFGKAAYLHQNHSDIVVNLRENETGPIVEKHEGDAIITAEKDIAISVHTADCLPILVYHPDGFIAAVHAGWRGTLQKIALKTAS